MFTRYMFGSVSINRSDIGFIMMKLFGSFDLLSRHTGFLGIKQLREL